MTWCTQELPFSDMIIHRLSITHTLANGRNESLNFSTDSEMTDIVYHPWLDTQEQFNDLTLWGVLMKHLTMIWLDVDLQSPPAIFRWKYWESEVLNWLKQHKCYRTTLIGSSMWPPCTNISRELPSDVMIMCRHLIPPYTLSNGSD
jgi:hypothetical protein